MPKTLTKKDILDNLDFYLKEMRAGKLFIYPTDTLHGLGTNAKNAKSIEKINTLKKRANKSFLVIAPSFAWIFKNCTIPGDTIRQMLGEKLPGPYSFILKLKNSQALDPLLVRSDLTIGVRLPACWFLEIIAKSGVPFVSTSINFSGEPSAKSLADIPAEIFSSVDYVIWDESSPSGYPSTIIDATSGAPKILRA